MQKTGKLICTHCMKETSEFCYYKPFLNIIFEVVKNKFGHYMLTTSENSDVKLTMIGKPDMKRGLPLKFRVRYSKDGQNGEFTALPSQRICPHCYWERKEIQYLSPYTGYYPTYTIAIVGMPSVGKSGWSNSCISEKAKKDAAIRFRKGCVESERLVANQMPERNKLIKELILIDEKGKDKALILLCDTPGELLTQDAEVRGVDFEFHMQRVLAADALIYMLDDRRGNSENSWLSDIFFYTKNDHPISVVLTKLDKYEKRCRENKGIICNGDRIVLTEDYFKAKKENELSGFSEKAKQMLVDKSIIRMLAPEIDAIVAEHKQVGYFTISSGTPDPTDENILHHENAVGNFLPLEYILGCWGLYDYKRR